MRVEYYTPKLWELVSRVLDYWGLGGEDWLKGVM